MIPFTRVVLMLSMLFVAGAGAEAGRVCMGGDIEELNSAQLHTCQAQVAQVRQASIKYHVPDWHFIVICDEGGWNDYAAFSEKSASELKVADADTNMAQRTTFLRGSHLNQQLADAVLATEMTAILRQTEVQIAESH